MAVHDILPVEFNINIEADNDNNNIDIVKNTLESTLITNGIDPNSLNISYATKPLCDEEFYL